MTGPEHYRKAESLLASASATEGGSNVERYSLAAAQVHATLALAAATVSHASAAAYAADVNLHDLNRWQSVVAPPAPVDEDEDEEGVR